MNKNIVFVFLVCLVFTFGNSKVFGAENTTTIKISADKSGLFGVSDTSGKVILPFKYDVIEALESLPNHLLVGLNNPNGTYDNQFLLGVMTTSGKTILPIKYAFINYDKDFKHFKVSTLSSLKNNKVKQSFGFLDANGKVIVPLIYDELQRISNMGDEPTNLGKLNGKFGYINIVTGKVMIPFEYEQLLIGSLETDAQGNGVIAARKNKLFGLITTNNVVVCPFKYDFIDRVYETNVEIAKTGGNLVSINFKDNKCVDTPLLTVVYSSNYVPRAPVSINPKDFDGLYAAKDYPTMISALEAYQSNKLSWIAIPSLQINGDKAYVAFGQFVKFAPLMFNELTVTKQKDGFSLMEETVDAKGKKASVKFLSFVQKNGFMFCDTCESLNLPSQWRRVQAEKAPEFVGIGVAIDKADAQAFIEIKEVLNGGAADKAGLKAGDLITEINGVDTRDYSISKATLKIRGEPGTQVKLNIARNGKPLAAPVAVTRGLVKLN